MDLRVPSWLVFAGVLALGAPARGAEPAPTAHPREMTWVKREWGVEVMFVRQTAGGYMLEFRYKVLDAARAAPLFDRGTAPLLTHAESGVVLAVPHPPTTGELRNSNPPIDGKVYWMFFANPGQLVQPGDHVSVRIGAFAVDGLVVR